MPGKPVIKELSNGIRYFWVPTDKFKTVSLRLMVHQELRQELATKTALLPKVLERGSTELPDSISLRRKLDNLYGADISTGTGKAGERQVTEISLEMVDPRYTGDEESLLAGMKTMKNLLVDPLVENGGFRNDYVEQEKFQLKQEIHSLLNDKTGYALERCIQEMCKEERYGVYRLGRAEDIGPLNSVDLYHYQQQLLAENPIDLFMVGMEDSKKVDEMVNEVFNFPRRYKLKNIPDTSVTGERKGDVKTTTESMAVNQGKLVMGYRTGITYGHELFYPMIFLNGVLGTFPHSKLFQNVREKASLAYFVFSRVDKHKGLMVIAAGIDPADYDRTVNIVGEQLAAACRGEFTREEIDNTRVGLINQLRAKSDSPGGLISFYFDADMGGESLTFAEVIDRLNQVTTDELQEAARHVHLDTIYFLRGTEEGVEAHE